MSELLQRFDVSDFDPSRATIDEKGFLRCDSAPLTRTGVFTYVNVDGSQRREYRPPEEVFNSESLASFRMMPVTLDHPPARTDGLRLLDAESAPKHQVGFIGDGVRRDGDWMRGPLAVTNAKAVAAVKAGKNGLSNGYTCMFDATPGTTPGGERYDGIQRMIRGNHSSLVAAPRAGAGATLRLDSAGNQFAEDDDKEDEDKKREREKRERKEEVMDDRKLGTVVLDGIQYRADSEVVNLIEKMRTDLRTVTAAKGDLKVKLDQATARHDQMKERLDAAGKATSPETITRLVNARIALLDTARAALPKDQHARLDAMDDAAIRKAVILARSPDFSFEGRSADYVAARFDSITEEIAAGKGTPSTIAAQRTIVAPRIDSRDTGTNNERFDAAESRRKMVERNQSAWKPPATAQA